jgi:hypothetical protein
MFRSCAQIDPRFDKELLLTKEDVQNVSEGGLFLTFATICASLTLKTSSQGSQTRAIFGCSGGEVQLDEADFYQTKPTGKTID